MAETAKIIQCPTCGGSSSPKKERCDFCGNYLLHLTFFEQRKTGEINEDSSDKHYRYFYSLARWYKLAIGVGTVMTIYLYFIAFDDFSETELVTLSPIWFLCLHFGISGLYTEKAVSLILEREANNFKEGLQKATARLMPFSILIYLVFMPIYFLFPLKKLSSPLLISVLTTLAWAGLLYFFLVGIFPAL